MPLVGKLNAAIFPRTIVQASSKETLCFFKFEEAFDRVPLKF
jgi:hypothetical protein